MKFDIVCDNGVSLQTKVVYMKFQMKTCCCWLGQWGHFTPISHQQQLCRQTFFFGNLACGLHVIISRQMKCKTFLFFKSFKESFTVPQICSNISNWAKTHNRFSGSSKLLRWWFFKNIFFSKRFSITFCIWKSNRFFSLHWASSLKMGQSQNRGYESETFLP